MNIRTLLSKENLKKFLLINLGLLCLSVGVYFFKFPNNFSTGGVSGISIIVSHIFPNITGATFMMYLNIALLIVGFIFFGRGFGFFTCYCSLAYSAETWLFEKIYPMTAPFTDEPLLELIFAIMLPAVGSALLFNYGASSGGTDIVAMVLKKFTNLDIGKALFVSDGLIALSACYFFGMKTGLFSVLGLTLKAFLVDSVIESVNTAKFFTIVTTKPDEITEYIMKTLKHGATVERAVGAYTGENKSIVLTACKRSEGIRLRQYCKKVDPKSFMFITNSSEIIGKGFRQV
ncbi:MAG: YitT family protein [Clostridia bacterium]|nr:YitT family protein [Clostridia bacterium]